MDFILIAAFAILLTDDLPPPEWNALGQLVSSLHLTAHASAITLAVLLAQIPLLALLGWRNARRALREQDGTAQGDIRVEDRYSTSGYRLLGIQLGCLFATFLGTDWLTLV